ncbi:MAG TPA: hypothetical protein VGC96_04955 [Candidatus Elarobacter sp.]|jgi:hypothetical protein
MRSPHLAAALALSLGILSGTAPAGAQAAAGVPEPVRCVARESNLGGVGRASVVAFTGPVLGAPVCATVANLSFDAFTAALAPAGAPPPAGVLVAAALSSAGAVTVSLEGATVTGVGPYVVAPGGVIPSFGGDIAEARRVVLAYAGQRVLVIGTSPVALIDLARVLRAQPALFGTDAVERAVLLASGPDAAISLTTADGTIGAASIATPRQVYFMKRG